MAQVTSPIILDSTGQQIHSDLQQIKNVLTTPSAAADITFDNTGTGMQADDVQDAITELNSSLTELTTLYNANNCTLTKHGRVYQLRCNGVTASNLTTALTAIRDYFPTEVHSPAYTMTSGNIYLANFVISGSAFQGISVVGTYNSTPVNFFTTSHSFYCDIIWIK